MLEESVISNVANNETINYNSGNNLCNYSLGLL